MSAPVSQRTSTNTAMTPISPTVIWHARVWAFLSDVELRVVPCVSWNFVSHLPTLKMQRALELALYHQRETCQFLESAKLAQTRACQFLELANLATIESKRTPLYLDFRRGGASKIQPLPSMLRAEQAVEPIFTSTYTISNDRYDEGFDETDPVPYALETSLTTYGFIEVALKSVTERHVEEEGDEQTDSSSSITEELHAGKKTAERAYSSEEEEGEYTSDETALQTQDPNRTALCFRKQYRSRPTGSSKKGTRNTLKAAGMHFHFSRDNEHCRGISPGKGDTSSSEESETRRLRFTPALKDPGTPVVTFTGHPSSPCYPRSIKYPPSDPRWKAVIQESQNSPGVSPSGTVPHTLADRFTIPTSTQLITTAAEDSPFQPTEDETF